MEQNKKDLIIQASKASWVISLANLGFAAFANAIIKSSNSSVGVFILGGFTIVFFIVGIICGVVGLSGVKQYGIKSIPVPSVIGIILNGFFLFVLFAAAMAAYQRAAMGG